MHMLESAMAFAVVMIIFSTIVSGLAEAYLRLIALKQRALGDALEKLLQKEVLPALLKALGDAQNAAKLVKDAPDEIKALAKRFSDNPLMGGAAPGWWDRRMKKIDELTTYSFLQRLAKSPVADAILELDDKQLEAYLANVSRTYERYAAASREVYRKWSYVVTTVTAILFAVVFNVDAGRVYVHLMDDPASRAALLAQADDAIAANEEATRDLRALVEKADEAIDDKTEAEVTKELSELRVTLAGLETETRLPVGPSQWPYCFGEGGADWFECDPDRAKSWASLDFAFWVFNVLLAGVLIGLGGPFWAKVYTQLAALASRLPGAKGQSELVNDDADDGPPAAKKAADDPVAAFKIAAGKVP